jgi:hypothetical protein
MIQGSGCDYCLHWAIKTLLVLKFYLLLWLQKTEKKLLNANHDLK